MQLKSLKWRSNQPLAEDYINREARVKEFYDYDYGSESDWMARADWLGRSEALKADRPQLVNALLVYNRQIGNTPEALQSLEKLRDERALAVVGGQQAGLFGGPLLVMYKAVTIIQTAREWEAKLGRPVVPLFWIAGEDHDFDEVNHVNYLSNQLQIEKIKMEHPTGRRTSVSRLAIQPKAWEEALSRLDASLMDTEFKPELLLKLRNILNESETLSDAFGKLLAMLFGKYGLVLLDSDDPGLRQVESAMFERLVLDNELLGQALVKGRERVEAFGYQAQAEIQEHGANLFVFEGGQRLLLQREGEFFADKKKEFVFSKQQLLDMAFSAPDRLSNNVMTRPLMQEYLFPVLGTVLGPGEIAYWALTRQAFHAFGMKMPLIVPRLEFTLVEGTVQKNMAKYGLTLEDVLFRFEEKKQEWLNRQDTFGIAEKFASVREGFKQSYQPLVESLAGINPGLKKLGETNLVKIIEQIGFLESKAEDEHKTQFDSSLRQLERIRLTMIPLAKPQERVYNICAYLNRYGDDWLKALVETPIQADGIHRVYYL